MVTTVDENKGLVKVYWQQVRDRVAKVNPVFAKLIDDVSPDKTFPLYLAYYPYGTLVDDARTPLLPRDDGSVYRLTKDEAPAEVFKHLGYGQYNAPLGILLDKQMESFITLPGEQNPIPKITSLPGTISPFSPLLSKKDSSMYATNNLMAVSAGARSVFMLPNIGCMGNHTNLQRDFGIKSLPPKF